MPRTSNAKPVDATAAAVESEAAVEAATVENMNEAPVVDTKTTKTTKTTKSAKKDAEPLHDYDEIEVVSLIPNVSYKDSHTLDFYRWDDVGHVEYMTFETLKNMWRNSKGYLKNMWLKPLDERVIEKFFLTNTYGKYDFLMDEKSYERDTIDDVCKSIDGLHNGLKSSVLVKIKDMIACGQITDVKVIRALENKFDTDLISLLD